MKRLAPPVILALSLVLAGCASTGSVADFSPPAPRYRIAVASISQETNSFSPVPTTLRDFTAGGLWYGQEVIEESLGSRNTIDGFLSAVRDVGRGEVEVVPVMAASAMSGGPVERGLYERFKGEILAELRSAGELDGIYLPLHGAMGVSGLRDPEGDLLEAIRAQVGSTVPIGMSFDLHANITERRARLATFIVGYKTNPHRDFHDTGYSSGSILIRTIRGEVSPVMVVRKMRLLKGGGMNIDFLAPMNRVFREMDRLERDKQILSVSTFMVHIWLDDPELGWTTVAVADGDAGVAARTADHLADMCWEVRDVEHKEPLSSEEAIRVARRSPLARAFGTLVVCDAADAVGAGAPGESTWMLRALLAEGSDLTSYVPLRDEEAASRAYGVPVGETLTLTVGGKLDTLYNQPIQITATVLTKTEGRLGKTVVLRQDGIHLILSELPASASSPRFFTDLGLRLGRADLVVVKNLFPFRYTFLLSNRKTLDVLTPGTTDVDVFRLPYREVPRPIYPLDDIGDWR